MMNGVVADDNIRTDIVNGHCSQLGTEYFWKITIDDCNILYVRSNAKVLSKQECVDYD
jgi:hypothetical protein